MLEPELEIVLTWGLQHCAHFQKAACVTKWETQYMLDGTLPPEGTMCEVDESNAFIAAAKAAAAE
jgi:hypothetical protein